MASTITDGDVVIIQRYNYLRTHKIDTKGGTKIPRVGIEILHHCYGTKMFLLKVQLAKETVDLSNVLDHPYGATFKMIRSGKVWQLQRTEEKVDFEEKVLNQTDGGQDNREIIDQNRYKEEHAVLLLTVLQ